MEIFFDAFQIIFSPKLFALLCGSVLAGVVVGAAPGLTSTMAIGLLVPLTFGVSKFSAFVLLLGIYCGAIYGGSITAILMNVPGTPTAAVTAIEGYPMTMKGEGGKALGVATMSSTLGGLLSCVVLIFLSLQLAKVAIMFGPLEYFSLGLFATAVVLSLSSRSVIKGLIATLFGLLLSTIGVDPVAQYPRFTFGIAEILIGIPAVPAIIGLFCVSEAFRMAEQAEVVAQLKKDVSGLLLAYRVLPKLWKIILKSSVIGSFIGTLPGTGALVASFMAYGEAKRNSKTPELFGKGAVEGVCASEAANNAVTGGALVPLLTLGIPGDTNTLMLLGAMIIHGLIPGPTLFKEDTILVYVIFGTMIMCNLMILPIGLMLSTTIARISLIKRKYFMPAVGVLAITGASIGYGHIYYFWISIIFGFIGYVCQKGGFPVLAIAMCLILGPIMEQNLRAALMLPENIALMFLTRPISTGLVVASILAVVWGIRREAKAKTAELIS
ncbi:MAG: tripartite tricarboxylate transporter permease [Deltaproteobacteria bacterium]|nr:tripartite tricarboxylate transporter permease [Deltaproteobacteria bacterium]